jgi:hypothetical protein
MISLDFSISCWRSEPSRLVGLEGRKQFFEAEAFDGEKRFARSTATFIAVDSFKRNPKRNP